jgi:hypothetical protein
MCLVDPTSVPEFQCRIPENAELNDFGKRMLAKLTALNEDKDDFGEHTCINCYRLMPAALFSKNAHYAPVDGDLVIVGGMPRNTITSAIVMRVGRFVVTNSMSIYELGSEAKDDEELLKRYPLLPCDMVKGTPERAALVEVLKPTMYAAIVNE